MIDQADVGGVTDDHVVRGDRRVVRARRELGAAHSRRREAVQAELDKLVPAPPAAVVVSAERLRREREALAARGGIVPKTAAKVATDLHTWSLYEEEQQLTVGAYPSEEQVVEFAIWMTHHRERACLTQRDEAAPRLTGKVRRTIRNMLTELFAHVWPRRWAAYAELGRKERAAYEQSILKQVDGLHKQAALATREARAAESNSDGARWLSR